MELTVISNSDFILIVGQTLQLVIIYYQYKKNEKS